MGSTQSKEEVIIAQTASGDATAKITRAEWILFSLVAIGLIVLMVWLYKRCNNSLRRTIRQEIRRNEIRTSQEQV